MQTVCIPAEELAGMAGMRVKLTGGDRFHDDIEGQIAVVHNGGDVLELLLDGDYYPYTVHVADYQRVEVVVPGPNEVTFTGGETVPITAAQRLSLDRMIKHHGQPLRIAPEFCSKAIMLIYKNITIGIEPDGYAHS